MPYGTDHLSLECQQTYRNIIYKICGLFTLNNESSTVEQCEKGFEIFLWIVNVQENRHSYLDYHLKFNLINDPLCYK